MENNGFYKEKSWEMLLNELKEIKAIQSAQSRDIADIKRRIGYIYGFAAALSVVFTLLANYFRGVFLGQK